MIGDLVHEIRQYRGVDAYFDRVEHAPKQLSDHDVHHPSR